MANIADTNVYATEKYIVRKYDGVKSADDMAEINKATIVEMKKMVMRKTPIRLLLDLKGKITASFEVYEEAVKALDYYAIEKIAVIDTSDRVVRAIAEHTNDIYRQQFIKYRWFTDTLPAQQWLNQD
jgi:hypothetical protein